MAILRISAAEYGGVLLPQEPYARPENLGFVVRTMLEARCPVTQLMADIEEDITPPLKTIGNRYILMTPGGPDPAMSAKVHILPKHAGDSPEETLADARAPLLDLNSGLRLDVTGTVEVPGRTVAFTLASPSPAESGDMFVHEMVLRTGTWAVKGIAFPIHIMGE